MNAELKRLVDDYLNSCLSEADEERLATMLRQSSEARSQFVRATNLDSALRDHASAKTVSMFGDVAAWIDREETDPVLVDRLAPEPMSSVRRVSRIVLPIAAALAIGIGAYFFGRAQLAPEVAVDSPEANAVAVLATALDAQWGAGVTRNEGDLIRRDDLIDLVSGSVELSFFSGASVVMEGESRLRVIDEANAIFEYGRLRADVPPSASGFQIVTDQLKLVDIGTEFGLELPREGVAQVHVIDGEVQVFPQGEDRRWDLTTGQSLKNGNLGKADPTRFLSADDLVQKSDAIRASKFLQWKDKRKEIANDPDVVVYFPFDESTFQSRRIINAAVHGPRGTHGTLIGGERLPGRWPKKESLAFMEGADRIRIHIPGEYDSLSMASWIQMPFREFETNLSGLLLTDGYEHAECHWQISRKFDLFFSVQGGFDPVAPKNTQTWNQRNRTEDRPLSRLRPGTWHLLAVTYSGETGRVTHFVDGEPVFSQVSPLQREILKLKIGAASIGNWGTPLPHGDYPTQVRNLSTRMDEFIIWKRTLTTEEFAALYEVGRPLVN